MKKFMTLGLALTMALSLVACGSGTSSSSGTTSAAAQTEVKSTEVTSSTDGDIFESSDAPTFNLRWGHSFNEKHPCGMAAQKAADLIKERSNGKITIETFPSASLGGERDMAEALQLGTLDFMVGGPVLANFLPEFEIMNMPFLFESREHAYAALDGEFGDALLDKLETVGFVGLGWYENGFYDVMNSKVRDVTSYKDLKGLNIRTVESNGFMDGWTAIGVNPVPMAATELYTALQNGTIDGICLSINGTYYIKAHEGANQINYTKINMFFGGLPVICSKVTWDKLPDEYKALIAECIDESQEYQRDENQKQEENSLAEFEKNGLTISEITGDAREEWKDVVTSYVYPKYPEICTEEYLAKIKKYAP